MSEDKACPICQGEAVTKPRANPVRYDTDCPLCGNISLTPAQYHRLKSDPLTPRQAANARGFLQENPDFRNEITQERVDFLRGLSTPSVVEKAHKLLRFCAKRYPELGEHIPLPLNEPALIGACWASGVEDVNYLMEAVLQRELSFVNVGEHVYHLPNHPPQTYFDGFFTITPKGWVALDTTAKAEAPWECFVAMWFDPTITYLFHDAIYPAAKDAGYKAVRVDQIHHNNEITDEIIAGIRRGKFLIADFTAQRGGVYFEAGFARGLGKEVIWLVREDEIGKIHFDNRQYNFIPWAPDKLLDLQRLLTLRIQATIGQGPWLGTDGAATNNS